MYLLRRQPDTWLLLHADFLPANLSVGEEEGWDLIFSPSMATFNTAANGELSTTTQTNNGYYMTHAPSWSPPRGIEGSHSKAFRPR